jgi:hypothetical protein
MSKEAEYSDFCSDSPPICEMVVPEMIYSVL